MSRFLMQLLYLPVTIFMATVEALGRMAGGNGPGVPPGLPTIPTTGGAAGSSPNTSGQSGLKEDRMGADSHDLSGDDVKNVLYSILFTKRDLEATLKGLTEDVVNYSTDAGSYGGLQIASFTATGRFKRPEAWKRASYPEPNSPEELTVANIPSEDRRYITFDFKVIGRFPKSDADYEKRQTKALERIANNTDRL